MQQNSGVASPKKVGGGVRTMFLFIFICFYLFIWFLCGWACSKNYNIRIHTWGIPICKKTFKRICANPKRGLNRSGGSGPLHSPRGDATAAKPKTPSRVLINTPCQCRNTFATCIWPRPEKSISPQSWTSWNLYSPNIAPITIIQTIDKLMQEERWNNPEGCMMPLVPLFYKFK